MREIWRFEKYATANKCDKNVCVAYLSALLKGRTLNVFHNRPHVQSTVD